MPALKSLIPFALKLYNTIKKDDQTSINFSHIISSPVGRSKETLLLAKKKLLYYGNKIIIPRALQQDILQRIYERHPGIQRCQLRARHSVTVMWPGIITQFKEFC